MNKIEKLLHKMSKQDRNKITIVVALICSNNLGFLDIKKLEGFDNMYRIRVGKFRIKFKKYEKSNEIIEITRRNDNTY